MHSKPVDLRQLFHTKVRKEKKTQRGAVLLFEKTQLLLFTFAVACL